MMTSRTDFFLNRNQKKLYDRISDELGGKIELRNGYEKRWANELQDKGLICVEGDGRQTFAYVPIFTFIRKVWDGTYGKGMDKNYSIEIIKAPDLITAIGNYNPKILGVEFSSIVDAL